MGGHVGEEERGLRREGSARARAVPKSSEWMARCRRVYRVDAGR